MDRIPVPRLFGELDIINGPYGVDLVGHGLKQMLKNLPSVFASAIATS